MNEKDVLNGFENITDGDETGMFNDYGDTLAVDYPDEVCDTD